MQTAVAVALLAGLWACGGGGGHDEPVLPQKVALTAGNMDAAAHAVTVAPFAFGASSMVVGDSGLSPTSRLAAHVMGALSGARMKALAQPLTQYPFPSENCPAGGTLTVTFDDRNENGVFDIGDALIFDFAYCQMTVYDVTNGRMAIELLREDPNGFGGRVLMTQFAQWTTDGWHRLTIDGNALVDYAATGGMNSSTLQMRAESEMRIAVTKHGGYTDTVTLQPGFWQQSSYDGMQGMGSTTFGGDLVSDAAGGMMSVSTKTAFVDRDVDPYPMSGATQARGSTGLLTVTALSASDVQVGLDQNDCGTDEHTQSLTWEELF